MCNHSAPWWATFVLVSGMLIAAPALAQNQAQLDGSTLDPSVRSDIAARIESNRSSVPEDQGNEDSGGPAVDAAGNPANDPSANVLALTRAEAKRQDDLRNASERFILSLREADERMNALRWEHAASLRAAETRRVDDIFALRSEFQDRLAETEADRINAIRLVDVNAVQSTSDRAAEQASALALQLTQAAEQQRSLVASTEQSVAAALEQTTGALSGRITTLEQAQYSAAGRQTLSDPAIAELTQVVQRLVAAQNTGAGQTTGSSNVVYYVLAGISALGVLFGIIMAVVTLLRRPPPHPAMRRRAA